MDCSQSHFYGFLLLPNWMSLKVLLAQALLFAKRKLGCSTYFDSLPRNSFSINICSSETWPGALNANTKKKKEWGLYFQTYNL